nr:uncharacterized protein LOC105726946 [Aotus nancymaae]
MEEQGGPGEEQQTLPSPPSIRCFPSSLDGGPLGRGRRAWVRLCCPWNDTQGCGPAAEEAVVVASAAAAAGASSSGAGSVVHVQIMQDCCIAYRTADEGEAVLLP